MSLFKTKEFWSNHCADGEEFDQWSLKVSKINQSSDLVLLGSLSGTLRIFKPTGDVDKEIGYKPNDLLIEKCFSSAILQIGVGKLVSGSQQYQIALLHPRSVNVYSMVTKEGIAEHGTQIILNLVYEHKLKRSAANFTIGSFGGVQNRDFICVQSLDGVLDFFEQETFNFTCSLPNFLLPGPIVFVKSSDSFVTAGSDWCLQSYRYKILSDAGQNHQHPNEKKINASWTYNMGEGVLDIQTIYEYGRKQNFISVLGERNLYCFTDGGKLRFMKRLEFSPSCFHMYYLDNGTVMLVVVSEMNTLLVYQETSLKWSAQMQSSPVAVCRAFFREIMGALVLLSEDGYLQFSYLGTEPVLFSAPPLKNQEINFEDAQVELAALNKIIKASGNNDAKFANSAAEKELAININVSNHFENFIDESHPASNGQKCTKISVEIVPQAIFEEVHVSVFVQKPLAVTPQSEFYSNLCDSTTFDCLVFIEHMSEVPSLDLEVSVSFVSSLGVPKLCYKKTNVPLSLVMETCLPVKEGDHKITLNISQNPVALSTLFTEFMGENPLTANSNAVGFKSIHANGPIVTVLLAKNSQRYRLQSDCLAILNILVQEVVRRLKNYYAGSENCEISSSSLPVHEVATYITRHFEIRQHINTLQDDLSQLSAQFRLIQKRLVTKFKQKNPTPLTNLDVLLQDTNSEILKTIENLETGNESLLKSQLNVSCVMHLIANLLMLSDPSKDLSMLESALSPHIYDIDNQNWEDVLDASLCFLLRTSLAKSEKDKLRAPHTSFDEVKDVGKLEKHFGQVLERIAKKGQVLETNFDQTESECDEKAEESKHEVTSIGTEIGSSSSRILSARKSLLRRRHKVDE